MARDVIKFLSEVHRIQNLYIWERKTQKYDFIVMKLVWVGQFLNTFWK